MSELTDTQAWLSFDGERGDFPLVLKQVNVDHAMGPIAFSSTVLSATFATSTALYRYEFTGIPPAVFNYLMVLGTKFPIFIHGKWPIGVQVTFVVEQESGRPARLVDGRWER